MLLWPPFVVFDLIATQKTTYMQKKSTKKVKKI